MLSNCRSLHNYCILNIIKPSLHQTCPNQKILKNSPVLELEVLTEVSLLVLLPVASIAMSIYEVKLLCFCCPKTDRTPLLSQSPGFLETPGTKIEFCYEKSWTWPKKNYMRPAKSTQENDSACQTNNNQHGSRISTSKFRPLINIFWLANHLNQPRHGK